MSDDSVSDKKFGQYVVIGNQMSFLQNNSVLDDVTYG